MVGREQILKVHVRKVPLAPDVNLRTIARGTPGFSGADLANLINEAALMAARRNKRMVTQSEFEDAKDKVMMGAERKSLVMTEEEKMLTAYHEGGHAIVALNVKATDPVHKATIIPRGRALGMVMQLPERDKLSMSREQMTSRLAIMMGGRVAEELVFGREKVTSGAASDIEQATKLARMMVTRWGLSDELGTVAYGENQDEVFLGYQVSRQQNISEETSRKIDIEIRRLVEAGYAEAEHILDGEARRSRNARQGPARVRDADRRRDQGPARRQAADARIRDRAGDAALLRRADRRQGPPRPGARPARSAAAAAGVSSVPLVRTYTFVFDPDPDGGFVVTCPALPGLVTHGDSLKDARKMAQDAMAGFLDVIIEDGEEVPESDPPQMVPRFDLLARTLREAGVTPILEQLSTEIAALHESTAEPEAESCHQCASTRRFHRRAYAAAITSCSIRPPDNAPLCHITTAI